jgi:hypothetical protein
MLVGHEYLVYRCTSLDVGFSEAQKQEKLPAGESESDNDAFGLLIL